LWAERSQSTAKVRVLDHVDAALNVWDYKLAFGLLGNRADWPIGDLPDYESRQKTAEMMQAFLTGQSEKLMHICHAIPSPSRQQLQLAEYASQGESIPPLEIASIVKSPMSSPDHAEVRESGDQSGWAQYVVGLRQLAANQNHDALVTFGRIVTVYPGHAQALACRGIAAFRLRHDGSDGERYQEMAMHDISAALEIDPKNAGLLRCHTQLVEAMDNDNNATH